MIFGIFKECASHCWFPDQALTYYKSKIWKALSILKVNSPSITFRSLLLLCLCMLGIMLAYHVHFTVMVLILFLGEPLCKPIHLFGSSNARE